MSRTTKTARFIVLALTSLVIGCLSAQVLWRWTHHRYDREKTGYYYGYVMAFFDGPDEALFNFHFSGESARRWRWTFPTNIVYDRIQFEWTAYDSRNSPPQGTGVINLPSLAYSSSTGTGVLTRATLAGWLIGVTNPNPELARSVDGVFDVIETAGHGSLPAPRHHSFRFEQPTRGRMQHLILGVGVAEYVYIWAGLWPLLVALGWRLFMKKTAIAPLTIADAGNSTTVGK